MSTDVSDAGERYGKYELLKRIGVGGMAEVFLARQAGAAGFQKSVVIKRVLPEYQGERKFIEMFLDEAHLAARLAHPNICQVFDLGEAEGSWYIAMEYVPGFTLSAVLKVLRARGMKMPREAALRVMAQLCEALHYAHSLADDDGRALNIVHRDVTPSNVMLTPQGTVKLLDFGIARAVTRQHQTQVGTTKGKIGYMAPEQIRADVVSNRTDIFAAGTVLYLMLTGRPPYGEKAAFPESFEAMAFGRFPPPRSVSPSIDLELERIVLKAMAKEPGDRYATAFDLLKDLEAWAAREGLSMGPHVLSEMMAALASGADFGERGSRETVAKPLGRADDTAATARELGHVEAVDTGDLVEPEPTRAAPPDEPEEDDAPPTRSITLPPRRRRRRFLAAVVAGAVLVVAGLWALLGGGSPASTDDASKSRRPKVSAKSPGGTSAGTGTPAAAAGAAGTPGSTAATTGTTTPAAATGPAGSTAATTAGTTSTPTAGPGTPGGAAATTAGSTPPVGTATAAGAGGTAGASGTNAGESPRTDTANAGTVASAQTEEPAPNRRPESRPPRPPPVKRPPPVATQQAPAATLPKPKPGEKAGFLKVTTQPAAKVRVQGAPAGTTPLRLELPEGSYRVSLEYPGESSPRTLLVNVVADKETPVTDRQ